MPIPQFAMPPIPQLASADDLLKAAYLRNANTASGTPGASNIDSLLARWATGPTLTKLASGELNLPEALKQVGVGQESNLLAAQKPLTDELINQQTLRERQLLEPGQLLLQTANINSLEASGAVSKAQAARMRKMLEPDFQLAQANLPGGAFGASTLETQAVNRAETASQIETNQANAAAIRGQTAQAQQVFDWTAPPAQLDAQYKAKTLQEQLDLKKPIDDIMTEVNQLKLQGKNDSEIYQIIGNKVQGDPLKVKALYNTPWLQNQIAASQKFQELRGKAVAEAQGKAEGDILTLKAYNAAIGPNYNSGIPYYTQAINAAKATGKDIAIDLAPDGTINFSYAQPDVPKNEQETVQYMFGSPALTKVLNWNRRDTSFWGGAKAPSKLAEEISKLPEPDQKLIKTVNTLMTLTKNPPLIRRELEVVAKKAKEYYGQGANANDVLNAMDFLLTDRIKKFTNTVYDIDTSEPDEPKLPNPNLGNPIGSPGTWPAWGGPMPISGG